MITKKTVLILGAGASKDFGYPIGEELREFIYTTFKTKNTFVTNIARALTDWDDDIPRLERAVIKFANDLYHDADYSIDSFLERFQGKYLGIGKLAIAQAIAHHEKHDKLYESDHWLRVLYNVMKQDATLDTFENNKISFVTFNYDRSLEHFLFTSLMSYHENISQQQVKEIISKLPIIHLYDQIDCLNWQHESEGRQYGEKPTHGQVKEYIKNISIIFEKFSEDIQSRFQAAQELIEAAEHVYILGFGFHKNNLERLQLENSSKKILGTIYGYNDNQIRTISQRFKGYKRYLDTKEYFSFGPTGNMVLHDVDIYTFIKNIADLS